MLVVTATQLNIPCFRYWYYRYQLGVDPWAHPLGLGEPQGIITGRDVHKALLTEEEPETEFGQIAKIIYPNIQFQDKLELEETEVVRFKWLNDNVLLAGRIDGIGKLNGEPVIYELKTSKYTPKEAYWMQKELDVQLSMYAHLTGIRKIVLDFIRLPSISKQRYGDEWTAEVIKRITDDPSSYFYRLVTERTEEDIDEFLADVKLWVDLVSIQIAQGRFLRNPKSCDAYNRPCNYWKLCKGLMQPAECAFREPNEELQPELGEYMRKLNVNRLKGV